MTKVAPASLAPALLDYIRLRATTFTPEMQRFLREGCMLGYHPGDYALRAWESTLPQDLRFADSNHRSSNAKPLQWTLFVPMLAWNYEQVWHKSIELADVCNHWARIQESEGRPRAVEFTEILLGGLCDLFPLFPKKARLGLLEYWLNPANELWLAPVMISSSTYFLSQINARTLLNRLCTMAPKQGKGASASKRWATNLQASMAKMPSRLHPQIIAGFLMKDLPAVEKIRAARCAEPSTWIQLAAHLLPLLPDNEWTRYDLLPVRTPTTSLSAAACGKTHRELARIYAPTLTQTIDAVTTDEDWAAPAMIRQLVAKTYATATTPGTPAEQFDLPNDVGGNLFV